MRKKLYKILITGGAGFIGSEFTRQAIALGYKAILVDKLTYAGDLARLKDVKGKFEFYKADICNNKLIEEIFLKEKPDIVANFAAETHVDRSILSCAEFIMTNIQGAQALLEASRRFDVSRFVQISSDEIYGDIERGKFSESTLPAPSSPYSASKAGADLLVKSYVRTYDFPAVIVRPSNNYGPWQYPEKLIPVIIYKALKNEKVPVYAKGQNVREWLYVGDCVSAILTLVKKGRVGEVYNIGSGNERKNIEVVKMILDILGKPHRLIQFVQDRPGHDLRYSLDYSKIEKELGWQAKVNFNDGLEETVCWYKDNLDWLEDKVKYLKNYWRKVYKCR